MQKEVIMLAGFGAIIDRASLNAVALRMRDFRTKLLKEKPLTKEEEEELKRNLWGMGGLGRAFRDNKPCLELIEQWLRDVKIHGKKLKEQEEQKQK